MSATPESVSLSTEDYICGGSVEILRTNTPVGEFLTLANDTYVGKSIREYGEWSFGEIEMLRQLLTADSNIIEAGSNIGSHTLFLARDLCPQGQVFAFEPRRIVFQILCANMVSNGVTNVFAIQKGVGATESVIEEAPLPIDQEINFGALALGQVHGTREFIHIVPLDSMLEELPPIRLIKADVEGFEADLLRGARQLIARDQPILYLENDRLEKSEELLTLLKDLNYRCYWHITGVYRPNNFGSNPVNHFGGVASFNILCFPRDTAWKITDSDEITDVTSHPLKPQTA